MPGQVAQRADTPPVGRGTLRPGGLRARRLRELQVERGQPQDNQQTYQKTPPGGYFYTTHLYHPEIDPDNNPVERVNRKFVAIRNDGGGNRSADGMKANSVLFTIMATDRINGASFFDHLVRASSGNG